MKGGEGIGAIVLENLEDLESLEHLENLELLEHLDNLVRLVEAIRAIAYHANKFPMPLRSLGFTHGLRPRCL